MKLTRKDFFAKLTCMIVLKLAFGAVFFLLGWVFLYKPNLIMALNRIARDVLFNDRSILLQRKKLSILFFCLALLALYMGMTSLIQSSGQAGRSGWVINRKQYLLYIAMQDYAAKRYPESLQKYSKILEMYPNDPKALEMMKVLEKQK